MTIQLFYIPVGLLSFFPGLVWLLRVIWTTATLGLVGVAVVLHFKIVEAPWLKDAALWGKTKQWDSGDVTVPLFTRITNVPKKWFLHFYCVGVMWTLLLLADCINHIYGQPYPIGVLGFFRWLCPGSSCDRPSLGVFETLLGLILMVIQTGRRAVECMYLSVFSETKMHIGQYVVGIGFYLLVSASIVAESPFVSSSQPEIAIVPQHIYSTMIGVAMYVWTTYHQYSCHYILAALRPAGKNGGYAIPQGDWFQYVSSPHYLAEIGIYLSMGLAIGGHNLTWWGVVAFTIANLSWGALQTHQWYLKKFDEYPSTRKAILPMIL